MGVGISLSGLATAVAKAGGLGVISSVGIGFLEADFKTNYRAANQRALKREIRRAKSLTDGVVGVNIMVAISDFNEHIQIAFDEKVDIVFMGAGLPLKFPKTLAMEKIRCSATKMAVIVSSAKAARLIFKYWWQKFKHVPDAVVVEGPLAGGHLGFKKAQLTDQHYRLEKLVPEVLTEIQKFEHTTGKNIPVIAAGGIYSGRDIYKFLQMGAAGVQMATRFVATHECDASAAFKAAYLNCQAEDLTIIDSPVGLPGRAIRNTFLDEVAHGGRKPFQCPWKCLKTCDFRHAPYCIAKALTKAQQGFLREGYTFAGANAYKINEIISVAELIRRLKSQYAQAVTPRTTARYIPA